MSLLGSPVSLIVRGVEYDSKGEAAIAIPCTPQQITEYKRIHNCTMKEAADYFVMTRDNNTFGGKLFSSAKEYVMSRGANYNKVQKLKTCLNCGWEEAVDKSLQDREYSATLPDGSNCTVDQFLRFWNIKISRFYNAAKELGYSTSEMCAKINKNESYRESLIYQGAVNLKQFGHYTNSEGQMFCRVTCLECGRNLTVTRQEKFDFVHYEEFCLSHKVDRIKKSADGVPTYSVGDKIDVCLRDASVEAHCKDSTIRRVHQETGVPIQELLTKSYNEWLENRPPFNVDGKMCNTKSEVAKELHISIIHMYDLIKNHNNVQETIDYVLRRRLEKEEQKSEKFRIDVISDNTLKILLRELGTNDAVLEFVHKYPDLFVGSLSPCWMMAPKYDCLIDGKRYYTLNSISAALSIERHVVSKAIKKYESTQEAVDYLMNKEDGIFTIYGVEYNNIYSACRYLHTTMRSLKKFCSENDCTMQEGLDYLASGGVLNRHAGTYSVVYNDKLYTLRKDIAKVFDTSVGTLRSVQDDFGFTDQETVDYKAESIKIGRPLRKMADRTYGNPPYFYNGNSYFYIGDVADALGVLRVSLTSKARTLGSTQGAVDYYAEHGIPTDKWSDVSAIINGVTCTGLEEICSILRVQVAIFRRKMNNDNLTLEETIDYFLNSSARSLSLRKDFHASVKDAYVGRDGKQYFFVTCEICKRVLILVEGDVISFVHSEEFCNSNEVP